MHIINRIKKDLDIISKIDNKKDKYIYIWDYYKLAIISCFLVILLLILFIIPNKDKKILYMVLVNNDSSIVEVDDSVFMQKLKDGGVNIDNKSIDINNYLSLGMDPLQDVETLQVLNALFSITDLDIYVSDKEHFDIFGDKDAFCDLSLLIDKELLDKHKDDLYIYQDSEGNKIVGGIILHNDSIFHTSYYYHNDVIIGVVRNSVNLDNALVLIKQILSD